VKEKKIEGREKMENIFRPGKASRNGLRRQRMLAASESGHAPAIAEAPGLWSSGRVRERRRWNIGRLTGGIGKGLRGGID
jgi:hypothetical protein